MGPLRIHPDLPAFEQLKREGIWLDPWSGMDDNAKDGTVRVCVVNIMPMKEDTGSTPTAYASTHAYTVQIHMHSCDIPPCVLLRFVDVP
jgi:homoserine trans-succinylase